MKRTTNITHNNETRGGDNTASRNDRCRFPEIFRLLVVFLDYLVYKDI